ncbi:flippase [Candidatus Woesearchaeota archaeon]|nr:flippase [Candidatus Woesearchaeota archaeon]
MVQSIGKGTFYLMIAEAVSLFSTYIIHIGLARYLGPDAYGIFGVLMSLYLINNAFLGDGVPKAVSKYVAESKDKMQAIFHSSFKLQLLVAIFFCAAYVIFSEQLALVLHDISLKPYIIFLGFMVIPLSLIPLYANGYLNGLRLFRQQALIKIIYPLFRVAFTFIFIYLGFEMFGVLAGYLIALLFGLFLCWYFVKIKDSSHTQSDARSPFPQFPLRTLLAFSIPVTAAALGLTLIRNVNVLFLKSLMGDNILVGYYTAAATLSNVPYLIFSALPLALLPAISRSVAAQETALTKKYITQSVRYLLLLLLPMTLLVAATSKEIVTLFYSSAYTSAASVLGILIFSSMIMVFVTTLSSIVTGSGKPHIEMIFMFIIAGTVILLNFILIPLLGMIGAALSSLIASLFALIIAAAYIYKKWHALISFLSFFRIAFCSVILFFVASLWHFSGILIFVNYAILLLLYVLLLMLFGELRKEDVSLVQKIFKRGH